MCELRDAGALRGSGQAGEGVGLEVLQSVDAQLADEELVLAVGEVLQPAEQELILRQRSRLQIVARIEVAREAVVELRPMNRLILGFRIERPELGFRRGPIPNAKRLARIFLSVRRTRQPDRAVAVRKISLLGGRKLQLVNRAIDRVTAEN